MENNNDNNSLEVIAKEYLKRAGIEVNADISVFEMNKDEYIHLELL